MWVAEAGFAEGAQECHAACAHFALPVFEGVFEGGVVAGAGGFAHVAGFVLYGEVFGAQDAVVEGFDGPSGDEWAHGFDEVAGEGFAAVFDAVVVADAGVQSGEVDLSHHGVVQQGVAQGEADVVRVAWRVAVAFCEVEAFWQDAGDGGEGGRGGAAFNAAQGGEVAHGFFELAAALFELCEGFVDLVPAVMRAGLQVAQELLFALDFFGNPGLCLLDAEGVVLTEVRLGEAAQGVFARAGQADGGLLAASAEDEDADVVSAQFAEVGGAQGEVALDADAVDEVQRQGASAFTVFVEDEGVAGDGHAGVFAVDVEGAHGVLHLDDEQGRVGGTGGFGFAEQARFGLFGHAEDVQAVGGGGELGRDGVEEAAVFGVAQPAAEEGLLAAGGVPLKDAAHARLGAGVADVVGDEVRGAVRHGVRPAGAWGDATAVGAVCPLWQFCRGGHLGVPWSPAI